MRKAVDRSTGAIYTYRDLPQPEKYDPEFIQKFFTIDDTDQQSLIFRLPEPDELKALLGLHDQG